MPRHSYSFADPDAPALKHLLGVRAFAVHMLKNAAAEKHSAKTQREQQRVLGKIEAYREILDVLDESELIVNARPETDEPEWGDDSAAQQLERGPR